jgi:hypothetical protein
MELSEYTFTVEHKPGTKLAHADALSRIPPTVNSLKSEIVAYEPTWNKERIAKEQSSCPELEPLHLLTKQHDPNYFYDKEGVLFKVQPTELDTKFTICAPRSMRKFILSRCHTNPLSGHLGVEKTLEIVQRHFNWKGCYSDTVRYVPNCIDCKKRKFSGIKIPLQPVVEAAYPIEKLALDISSPAKIISLGTLKPSQYLISQPKQ